MKFFSQKNIKYFLTIIVLIIVIFVSARGANNPLKGFFLRIESPFSKTFRIFSGGTEGFFHFLGSIGELKSENEKLLQENGELLAKNALLKDIGSENKLLRQQLDLLPRKNYDLEASFIVAQDPQGLGNYLLIDKGGNNGLKTGMPIIISNGILVGKITDVYPTNAKVVLISDKNSAVNAEIEDSGAKGIVRGVYGLGLMMDMISQSEEVKEGDTVITSGLGGDMPRGLYIGKVKQARQSSDKLFQQASLISPVDFSSLSVVFVVKGF
jgi:rod shape-determining protein MreC